MRLFSSLFQKLEKNGIKVKIALSGNEQEIKKIAFKIKQKVKPIAINAKFFLVDQEQVLFYLSDGSIAEDEAVSFWLVIYFNVLNIV